MLPRRVATRSKAPRIGNQPCTPALPDACHPVGRVPGSNSPVVAAFVKISSDFNFRPRATYFRRRAFGYCRDGAAVRAVGAGRGQQSDALRFDVRFRRADVFPTFRRRRRRRQVNNKQRARSNGRPLRSDSGEARRRTLRGLTTRRFVLQKPRGAVPRAPRRRRGAAFAFCRACPARRDLIITRF